MSRYWWTHPLQSLRVSSFLLPLLCWFDKRTCKPQQSFNREMRNTPVQPRAEAACPPGGQGPTVPSVEPSSAPRARQDLRHGPASTARCSCCSQGACCTYRATAGFLHLFSVRRVGCGGLGDVNQSSPAGGKGVRLMNSGDRSAAVSFGNSSALTGVWSPDELRFPNHSLIWLSDMSKDGLCCLKVQPAVSFLHNNGKCLCWACLAISEQGEVKIAISKKKQTEAKFCILTYDEHLTVEVENELMNIASLTSHPWTPSSLQRGEWCFSLSNGLWLGCLQTEECLKTNKYCWCRK